MSIEDYAISNHDYVLPPDNTKIIYDSETKVNE